MDAKELRGKKISYTNRGAITEFALDLLVEAGGLTRREVQGVILRQGEAMGALAAGQIDEWGREYRRSGSASRTLVVSASRHSVESPPATGIGSDRSHSG